MIKLWLLVLTSLLAAGACATAPVDRQFRNPHTLALLPADENAFANRVQRTLGRSLNDLEGTVAATSGVTLCNMADPSIAWHVAHRPGVPPGQREVIEAVIGLARPESELCRSQVKRPLPVPAVQVPTVEPSSRGGEEPCLVSKPDPALCRVG